MALTVTRSRVKEKCGISDSGYDATIDNLIAELVPTVEAQLDLTNADTNTANLGATELICAEFLSQLAREFGGSEDITLGDMRLQGGQAAPIDLFKQGSARLAPYLRDRPTVGWAGPKVAEP